MMQKTEVTFRLYAENAAKAANYHAHSCVTAAQNHLHLTVSNVVDSYCMSMSARLRAMQMRTLIIHLAWQYFPVTDTPKAWTAKQSFYKTKRIGCPFSDP